MVKVYPDIIEKIDFTNEKTAKDYESTEFRSCTFDDISGVNLTDCLFNACNLSNASVSKAKAQDVTFKDCKLIGINFYQLLDFGLSLHFEGCMLDYASFDNKKLNSSSFKNCRLHGVNFTKTDLSKVSMENCDLMDAVFSGTDLRGMDFTSNTNFSLDPQINLVKKTVFASATLAGLLTRYDIIIK